MTPVADPVLQDLTACGFDSRPTGHCPRCDTVVPLRLSRSGPHVKGCCSTCGAYVRFLEQPGVLPFGRYRGRPIREVPHDYLTWLRRTPEVWDRLSEARRQAVEEALSP
jgi:hypothetical protein